MDLELDREVTPDLEEIPVQTDQDKLEVAKNKIIGIVPLHKIEITWPSISTN